MFFIILEHVCKQDFFHQQRENRFGRDAGREQGGIYMMHTCTLLHKPETVALACVCETVRATANTVCEY